MTQEGFKRKLAAIFSVDVKGYSRLMEEDEEATIRTITEYREIITKRVKQHEGRVVDPPGDNVLAEFASVVDALKCSVQTQKEIAEQNEKLPENRKMEFRIGVNLGDVAEEGDRIYGDGVNVAARIESLADPGGICISRTAYDQVKNKLPLGYEYLGEHSVKNIAEPIRVYRVLMDPEDAGKVIGEERSKPRKWRWAALATVVVLILVAGALAIWQFYFRPPLVEPASMEKMAFPLSDKPSVAVLPFVNMSDDPKQEYFSDGITENIITALSKVHNIFLIARNTTFTYKGKAVKIKQVAEELGVRYVLEGSVQKTEDRVHITAQLIDAMTGMHLWAERYDRDLTEIFALQDEITKRIITSLHVKLTMGDEAILRRGKPVAHSIWGNSTAVLVGDFLLARSLIIAADTENPKVIKIIAKITENMSQGEIHQLLNKGDLNLPESEYMEIIRRKTAVLIQGACQVGAIIANADKEREMALSRYGLNLGMAFQMVDDLLDYTSDTAVIGKTIGADLREGKLTLPVIYSLKVASTKDRAQMEKIIKSKNFSVHGFEKLIGLLKKYNGIAYTQQHAEAYIRQAKEAISLFGPSEHKQLLENIADYAITRKL